ncbi:MAG TPA: hypothetical protein VGY66_05830 [Gemmataceae bacterium]|jgi:hypothetical protein|nr:hypothetical protein [Gemmataceae bacterium]
MAEHPTHLAPPKKVHKLLSKRLLLTSAIACVCLLSVLWTYDALGYQKALQFDAEHANDPLARLENWHAYQRWHPGRNLLPLSAGRTGEKYVQEVQAQVVALDQAQKLSADRQRAQLAYDRLTRAEAEGTDLLVLVTQCDLMLREYPGSKPEADVRARRVAYLRRLEEREIETARQYSASAPSDFDRRREHYQHYLDRHPAGIFATEATAALKRIEDDWDKRDCRALRDLYLEQPGNIPELVARCRAYQAAHPGGRYRTATGDLLRWTERVSAPGEYRVVLRSGHFDKKVAHFFSRGPDLSVELEVAGARYGPSNIVVNSYDPEWNYEFPRRIRWKLGDQVRIRVTDHDYSDRVVVDISSADDDPLALGILAGDTWCGKSYVTFESDFAWPNLPGIE